MRVIEFENSPKHKTCLLADQNQLGEWLVNSANSLTEFALRSHSHDKMHAKMHVARDFKVSFRDDCIDLEVPDFCHI